MLLDELSDGLLVPVELGALLRALLQPDPFARPELAADVDHALAALGPASVVHVAVGSAPRGRRSRRCGSEPGARAELGLHLASAGDHGAALVHLEASMMDGSLRPARIERLAQAFEQAARATGDPAATVRALLARLEAPRWRGRSIGRSAGPVA